MDEHKDDLYEVDVQLRTEVTVTVPFKYIHDMDEMKFLAQEQIDNGLIDSREMEVLEHRLCNDV